ncbi:YqzL family protein [Thermohalobacter berrensis]|nr:YqzL family protein [Thermohalobacter berrensis]
MLRDEMWKIFQAKGNINAYLYYKESLKINNKKEKQYKKEKIAQSL